jgi:hypothetical protein
MLGVATSCTNVDESPRVVERAPDRAAFTAVSPLLESRCGNMDCHGVAARNMRIYSGLGLRLSATDRPTSKPGATTAAEIDANYMSIVALEPEIMSHVVSEGGAAPERLTVVRKARGEEEHTGHAPWQRGDHADQCLTSWLAGHVDTTACELGLVHR